MSLSSTCLLGQRCLVLPLFRFLVLFLAAFLFPSVFSSYAVQARYSVFRIYPSDLHKCPSLYLSPFCRPWSSTTDRIFSLRESSSRLCLHINALGSRESTSRLGLHNNALGLRESTSRLGLHTMPLVCPLFLSSVWLPSGFLSPGPGRLPASSYI
jgi:hypothetical protein